METLVATNESLMSTIDEVMKIQEDGRQKRAAAEVELVQLENDIKKKNAGAFCRRTALILFVSYMKKTEKPLFSVVSPFFYVLSYPYLGRSAFSFFLRYSVK